MENDSISQRTVPIFCTISGIHEGEMHPKIVGCGLIQYVSIKRTMKRKLLRYQ